MNDVLNTYVIWGGAGQAKVVRPILARSGHCVVAVFDNGIKRSPFADVPFLGGDPEFARSRDRYAGYGFMVAIGGRHGRVRTDISRSLREAGLVPLRAIHHTAFIADSASLGEGCQILPLAAICEEAVVGDYSIVNTKASVDHECRIGIGVHIMPGATLAGLVEVHDYATIGSGAVILPRLRIGTGATVGAGAVVTKDVRDNCTVIGCPAREIPKDIV